MRLPALILALAALLPATTLERLSMDDMILKSTMIVRGRINSSRALQQRTDIFTQYSVSVLETYKGTALGSVNFIVPGGAIGSLRQNVSGSPQMADGSELVLFLWTGKSGVTHLLGFSQGVYNLKRDAKGAAYMSREPITEQMLDSNGQPVQDQAVKMSLSDFSALVQTVLARAK